MHIGWDKCHASETSLHKGKEGFCTLSYEVTADHTKKILAATKGFQGGVNDKTIVKFQRYMDPGELDCEL